MTSANEIAPTSGANDTWMQKILRFQGRCIGRYPAVWGGVSFIVCIAVALAGWCTREPYGGPKEVLSPEHTDLQWSAKGGKLEKGIRTFLANHGDKHPWQQKYSTTMFQAKGTSSAADDDVLTKAALLEMRNLYEKWTTLEVTTSSGLVYSTWDLCARGAMPDLPAPATLFMPCMSVSPLHCFKEEGSVNHPSYQMLDPLLDLPPAALAQMPPPIGGIVSTLQSQGYVSYAGRPSLANMTDDAQIKAVVSQQIVPQSPATAGKPGQARGCLGSLRQATYTADNWGGLMDWSNGELITRAGALRIVLFIDGAERVKFRLGLTKPTHTNVRDIDEAQELLSAAWNKLCIDFNRETKVLEVANLEDVLFYVADTMREQGNEMQWELFVASGISLLCFCCLVLSAWRHPMASRVALGSVGLFLVIFSAWTAFGLFLWDIISTKYLNSAIVAVLPMMALGLGVNDMFVLIRYLSGLGLTFIDQHTASEIMGEILARAGTGAALTSWCNVLVFVCGALLPVPAMADFCLCASILAFVNHFVMINIFMPVAVAEVKRIKARSAEPHPLTFVSHFLVLRRSAASPESESQLAVHATSADEYSHGVEKKALLWLRTNFAAILSKPSVGIIVALLSVLAVIASCIFISNKSIGYSPQDLFENDDPMGQALQLYFEHFSVFPTFLCFHDVDVAANQVEMLKLFSELTSHNHMSASFLPNYLTSFYTTTMMGAMMYAQQLPTVPDSATVAKLAGFNNEWSHPVYAPVGTLTTNATEFYESFNGWRSFPANQMTAMANPLFMIADLAFAQEFTYTSTSTGLDQVKFSFFAYNYIDMADQNIFVDVIEQTNAIIEKSPLRDNVFVYGPVPTFWQVFIELDKQLWALIGIEAIVIFVMTLLVFNLDVATAFTTCVSCTMISVEVYGVCAACMDFNIFVAANVLVACALSVEYTAHFTSAFNLATGSVQDRLGAAMAHTFPAIAEGGLSTLIGIFPLAFSTLRFNVNYFFVTTSLVVLVGLFNGFLVLPAWLAVSATLSGKCQKMFPLGADQAPPSAASISEPAAPAPLPGDGDNHLPRIMDRNEEADGKGVEV